MKISSTKEWYLIINGKKNGPFSISDLKRDKSVTPDSLIWKEGFDQPIPIRLIPELKDLFKDDQNIDEDEEENNKSLANLTPKGEIVIDWHETPPSLFLWFLLLIIVIVYVLYQSQAG